MEDNTKPITPAAPEKPETPKEPKAPSGVNMNRMNVELQGDKPENQVITVTPKHKHSESGTAFETNLPKNREIAQTIAKPQNVQPITADTEQLEGLRNSGFMSGIVQANEQFGNDQYEQMSEGQKFMKGFAKGLGLTDGETSRIKMEANQKGLDSHDRALASIDEYYGSLKDQFEAQKAKVEELKAKSEDPNQRGSAKEYAEASKTLEAMRQEMLNQNKALQERKKQLEVSRKRLERAREATSTERINRMFGRGAKGASGALGKAGRTI